METSLTAHQVSKAIARFRAALGIKQSTVAEKAGLDQSKISRIEKGDIASSLDVKRILDALEDLGASDVAKYRAYCDIDWKHIEPPSFWNPQRACLELAEETLLKVGYFLANDEASWPLRRQIEKHRDALIRAAKFLTRTDHNIAFIGDIGVGKSTAISFIFGLLISQTASDKTLIHQTALETGAGGTTICEIHIKNGPEYGVSVLPLPDSEVRALVADFCAAKWFLHSTEANKAGEPCEKISISREVERAIRNMAGLTTSREITAEKKPIRHDPIVDIAKECESEEEFRTRVLGLLDLPSRNRREIWYESTQRKHPMEWLTETFKAINNGRLKDVPMPKTVDLMIPDFCSDFGELDVTVIDTKGIDDIAVREDLDLRLKDPRTTVVFCSRFNDAPGNTTHTLLKHMKETFPSLIIDGKIAILALPHNGEALNMKDDTGEPAYSDEEGYDLKRMQVTSSLVADDLADLPVCFYNVQSDAHKSIAALLSHQLTAMRLSVEENLFSLSAAVEEIIENHEEQDLTAAVQEVANRLNTFLSGNRNLATRERMAYAEVLSTVRGVRYASTLWASTRRNGEYSGMSVNHLIGVGAGRDAQLRCRAWFTGLDAFINSLKADEGLNLATRTIDQIAASAIVSRTIFLESTQRAGIEVYREPLSKSQVWQACANEWGRGAGFKGRVADALEQWFDSQDALKTTLETMVNNLWEKTVISPLRRLAEENAPEPEILPNRKST